MTCEGLAALVGETERYVTGSLSPAEHESYLDHLINCPVHIAILEGRRIVMAMQRFELERSTMTMNELIAALASRLACDPGIGILPAEDFVWRIMFPEESMEEQ